MSCPSRCHFYSQMQHTTLTSVLKGPHRIFLRILMSVSADFATCTPVIETSHRYMKIILKKICRDCRNNCVEFTVNIFHCSCFLQLSLANWLNETSWSRKTLEKRLVEKVFVFSKTGRFLPL